MAVDIERHLMATPVFAIKVLTVDAWLDCECADCGGKFDIERAPARMAPTRLLRRLRPREATPSWISAAPSPVPHCGKVFDQAARVVGESVSRWAKREQEEYRLLCCCILSGCKVADVR